MIKYYDFIIDYFKSKFESFENSSRIVFVGYDGFFTFDFKERTIYVEWIELREMAEKNFFDDVAEINNLDFNNEEELIKIIEEKLEF